MLGMGPLIWAKFSYSVHPASRVKAAQPGYPFSRRYYRAIDSVTRGERRVCGCDLAIPRHDITGRRLKLKAFP